MDLVGGVFLAGGRECKLVTGIDDHARYVVIAQVVVRPTGRAVVEAFTAVMHRYGVPSEVLTDNGEQFTGRFTRPFPAGVLFERVCRESGIGQHLTKRRAPTTTGKIERFHKTLRTELLDEVKVFVTLDAAQEAIDNWVHSYSYIRPHQALDMATPASHFRPSTAQQSTAPIPTTPKQAAGKELSPIIVDHEPTVDVWLAAVEWEVTVPAFGLFKIAQAQSVWVGPAFAGRIVTVWADQRSIHIILDRHQVKTLPQAEHLHQLRLRGARTAGPAPSAPALPFDSSGRHRLPPNATVEVDRIVNRDGIFRLRNQDWTVDAHLIGERITLRLDGHVMHAIADNALVKSWPYSITLDQRLKIRGARQAITPVPPAPPDHAPRSERRVPTDGVIMVATQRLRVGRAHAGKLVTVYAEDTHFRILDGDKEIAVHPRTSNAPLTRFKAWPKRQSNGTDL
ncbi:integrase core domain-containing protein [Nocardia sp. SYP-A9097]|uniref:Mu transposase domain-containing protein n=1 Tax=Nocardia sp. SYP-A9097 TaxID=2663237 RepID=UPI0018917E57|nr:integrase core domain-containing protein [Nocardia sp. SYP-A9097]